MVINLKENDMISISSYKDGPIPKNMAGAMHNKAYATSSSPICIKVNSTMCLHIFDDGTTGFDVSLGNITILEEVDLEITVKSKGGV